MTHSLEVAQIARSLARELGANEALAEALALIHDIGHAPFGHKAEDELSKLLEEQGVWFEHNLQAYRIATQLEERYGAYRGLNLSKATLAGIIRHNSFFDDQDEVKSKGQKVLPRAVFDRAFAHRQPTVEAQIVNIADVIAYATHDIEDALNAGLLSWECFECFVADRGIKFVLQTIQEQLSAELHEYHLRTGCRNVPVLEKVRRRACSRLLIGKLMSEVVAHSRQLIDGLDCKDTDVWLVAQGAPNIVVDLPPETKDHVEELVRCLLLREVYNHPRVLVMIEKAKRIVRCLFQTYTANPDALPKAAKARFDCTCGGNLTGILKDHRDDVAQVVGDHIAGMTDKYAMDMYQTMVDAYEKAL